MAIDPVTAQAVMSMAGGGGGGGGFDSSKLIGPGLGALLGWARYMEAKDAQAREDSIKPSNINAGWVFDMPQLPSMSTNPSVYGHLLSGILAGASAQKDLTSEKKPQSAKAEAKGAEAPAKSTAALDSMTNTSSAPLGADSVVGERYRPQLYARLLRAAGAYGAG